MSQHTGSIPVEDVHHWTADATQRLLGFTIGMSDEQWREPSPLPGWSNAHVATHLARSADYLREVTTAVSTGQPQPQPPSSAERRAALEAGADRTGLELQIDLDTSAGGLQAALDTVTYWTSPVVLHGRKLILAAIGLSRLHEVCLHHLDMDPAYGADDLDPDAAAWLLRWVLDLVRDTDLPSLSIEGYSLTTRFGSGEEHRRVTGTDARLWAWLSGRLPASAVSGADGLRPALLG